MSNRPAVHVWPLDPATEGGSVVFAGLVEKPGGSRDRLWYSVPEASAHRPRGDANPFAIACLFLAMAEDADLRIHGVVSPSLLRNLEELSRVWHRWKPDRYRPVGLHADREQEREASTPRPRFLAAFSGGVDSLFTLYRHVTGQCGRQRRPVTAALMVHGFDIPLGEARAWDSAQAAARETCEDLGVTFLTIRTNWRALGIDWEDGFGAALASCLTFFAGEFQGALVGGDEAYDFLSPWGTTPLTVPMHSSGQFQIENDGSGFTRVEKVALVAGYPAGCRNLRVCWEGPRKDRNCCRCEKCIRTILDFRVASGTLPPCFETDATLDQVRALRPRNEVQAYFLRQIVDHAREAGRSGEEWVRVLEQRLRALRSRRLRKAVSRACRAETRRLVGRVVGR